MAKLIDPLASERPVPRPTGRARMREPILGDAEARGLGALGAALEQGADEMYRRGEQIAREAKIEQERVDTLRAEEAYTRLRERQLDLSLGEENGFTKLRGAAAVTRPLLPEWSKRFEDTAREIEAGLANDGQRLKFKQRAEVSRLQFQEGILRHLAAERETYGKEVYDGIIVQAQRDAVANWQSPNEIAMSLDRVKNAIEERFPAERFPKEYRDAQLQVEQGKIHATVVRQALAAGNYLYAQDWANQHKGDIDSATAATITKAVEDGEQKQRAAGYRAEYLASQNDVKALRALNERVLGDQSLDDNRRNVQVGQIQNRIAVLEVKAEQARERQLRRVERALGEMNASTLAGFEPSPEQFAPIIAAARGTELEGELKQAIALANQTRAFRNAPPVQQERLLAEAEAGVRNEPTKFDRRVVGAWRQIYDSQRRQVMDNPVSYAVQQGIVDPPAPLDLSNPAAAGKELGERFAIARGMQGRYQAPFKPLTNEEAGLLKATLQGATVEQKRNYFSGLYQAAGGDLQGYMGIMAQLAPDEPVTAIAGSHAARGRSLESELMLRGQAILTPSKKADGKPDGGSLYPMPPETDLRMRFDAYVREAFSGKAEARNAHYQAAKAIYAALAVDEGDRDTKVLDASRWERAMTMAIGPVEKHQGRRVVLPHGYELSQFRDGLRQRIDQVAESGRLDGSWTASRLRDLPLENVGDGRYVLRAGDGVVIDKQGRPVILDFNVSLPFRPSGEGLRYPTEEPTEDELAAAARQVTGRAQARPDRQGAKVATK